MFRTKNIEEPIEIQQPYKLRYYTRSKVEKRIVTKVELKNEKLILKNYQPTLK